MSIDSYEREVRALEQTRLNVDCPVVFYGSSSIRLWPGLERGEIVNRGFGGSTLEACAYYFERLILPLHPRSLIVYAGDNDLGDGRRPEQVLGWFRELAAKIDARIPGVPFGYISVKPSPARAGILDLIRLTNKLIEREMEGHPNGYFMPFFDSMLDAGGRPRPELFLSDGLHLSLTGYRLWESLLIPYQNRIFTPLSSKCNKPQLSFKDVESGV